MIALLLATAISIFVWYRYVFNSEWDESKKQKYISEQAQFSFDKKGFQKTIDALDERKNKFENFPPFAGRDIFFPEGW
jgi:hypothetical protein